MEGRSIACRKRDNMGRNKLVVVALVLFAILPLWIAYASGSLSLSPSVGTPGTESGKAFDIQSISQTFTLNKAQAQLTEGIVLYKLYNIQPDLFDRIRVRVIWTNPQDGGKVLQNPKSFIRVSLWYPDVNGDNFTIGDNIVTLFPTGQERYLSQVQTEALFSLLNENFRESYYIIQQITVPGTVPPGQVEKNELNFFIDVRS